MVSGLERYFQIARCFRDEDLRADRQPEFTQLDIELSFEDQDFILDLMEHMMQRIFKNVLNVDIQIPFKRITWDDAMNLYGSDKPDLRNPLRIIDVTDFSRNVRSSRSSEKRFVQSAYMPTCPKVSTRNSLNLQPDLAWVV